MNVTKNINVINIVSLKRFLANFDIFPYRVVWIFVYKYDNLEII